MNNKQNTENLIREYVRSLNQGNATMFAGAGLSIPSGGISWTKLLEDEANAIGIDVYKENDLTSVAQFIYNESGSRQVITQLLKNHINNYGKQNINHEIISSLPIHKVWTTNYDHYIENSFENNEKIVDVKRSVEDMTSEIDDADTTIYKMHGDMGNLNDSVILKDDYEIYDRKNELFTNALQNDLLNNTFLFFGFSFDDPNLQNILSKVRIMTSETNRRHYCILKEVTVDDEEFEEMDDNKKKEVFNYRHRLQRLKVNDLKRYGIHAVLVKDYDEMTNILQSIKYHYLSNTVFISGAYEKIDNFLGYKNEEGLEVANEFVRRLGAQLHRKLYNVKSGFGLGVGRNIIQGFLDEDAKNDNKKLSKDLTIHPFPPNLNKERKHNYRQNIMDEAGITIVLFGNKKDTKNENELIASDGIYDEYNVAEEKGQFVIPVGMTGYVANEMRKKSIRFTKVPEMNHLIEKLNDDSFIENEDMEKEEKIDYLIDIVFDVLDLYQDNINDIHYDLKGNIGETKS